MHHSGKKNAEDKKKVNLKIIERIEENKRQKDEKAVKLKERQVAALDVVFAEGGRIVSSKEELDELFYGPRAAEKMKDQIRFRFGHISHSDGDDDTDYDPSQPKRRKSYIPPILSLIDKSFAFEEQEGSGDEAGGISPTQQTPEIATTSEDVPVETAALDPEPLASSARGRRRSRDPRNWACNIAKRKRNLGGEYVSRKGKTVRARKMKAGCESRPEHTQAAQHSEQTRVHNIDNATAAYSAQDKLKQYEHLRDRLSKVQVPPQFKVADSSTGIKQEHRPTLKVVSKCARHAETGLKLLSTLTQDQDGSFYLAEDDMQGLFLTFASQTNFLQSEYASLVVNSTFNAETSRLFCSFENNIEAFNDSSLCFILYRWFIK
ncbi:hypothetical protein ElyMa_000769000 [Elysia marginata]|uniref:Uncharacterized protein n=1 Tax=Elysia marginata TaxID=1093978 RepID=A0AAV4GT75_9GAST|nr:hypothetical protein ElyMa_000769000 [Elysia marginata]